MSAIEELRDLLATYNDPIVSLSQAQARQLMREIDDLAKTAEAFRDLKCELQHFNIEILPGA